MSGEEHGRGRMVPVDGSDDHNGDLVETAGPYDALDLIAEAVRRADASEAERDEARRSCDMAWEDRRSADLAAELLRRDIADLRRRIRGATPFLVAIENFPPAIGLDGERWARLGRKVLEGYEIVNGVAVDPPDNGGSGQL